MSKKIFSMLILSVFMLCGANTVFGLDFTPAKDGKLYVQPGTIYVAPNGLYLNMEGNLYGITSVEANENGVYIPQPVAGFCGKHGYYPGSSPVCPYCQAENNK